MHNFYWIIVDYKLVFAVVLFVAICPRALMHMHKANRSIAKPLHQQWLHWIDNRGMLHCVADAAGNVIHMGCDVAETNEPSAVMEASTFHYNVHRAVIFFYHFSYSAILSRCFIVCHVREWARRCGGQEREIRRNTALDMYSVNFFRATLCVYWKVLAIRLNK